MLLFVVERARGAQNHARRELLMRKKMA